MSIGVGDGERARAGHRRDRPRPRVHADAADVRADPRVRLVAAFDPRVEAMARAKADFGARDHASVESLCADPAVDVVYVASPHQHHAAHVAAAAAGGKHVLVEKPMAVTLAEARAMIDAAGTCRRAPRRRAQPQLRPAHPARTRNHRERRGRRAQDDHRAVPHGLPLSPAPAGRARHRAGRRRGLQPGRAPGRHRPTAGRRGSGVRARADRALGPGTSDGGRVCGPR